MSDDFFETRDRLRKLYVAPPKGPVEKPRGEALGEQGFLTEVAGKVILTAPASTSFDNLPKELASRWQEMAGGSAHMMGLQGRFVEAEKANRNGAFWSTEDLQFGSMSVNHGPLNWLHQEKTVIGTIADNALVQPEATNKAFFDAVHAGKVDGISYNGPSDYYTLNGHDLQIPAEQLYTLYASTTNSFKVNTAGLFDVQMPRPYIAAASAVWKWVHPEKVAAIESAHDQGKLYYSMECIGRAIACTTDETHEGCGKEFDYVTAMLSPEKTCAHIASRSSARRIVDPSFLGGAVIVPPVQPGWGEARLEVMRQASSLAEQTAASVGDLTASEWERLMAAVVSFATS